MKKMIGGILLWVLLGTLLSWCLGGCADISPQKKGTLTVADRGAYELTERGDPLMNSGIYAKKNVSPDFAEGYEKGLSDSAKQAYWSMQEAQRWIGH
jgi:hypothetical protein